MKLLVLLQLLLLVQGGADGSLVSWFFGQNSPENAGAADVETTMKGSDSEQEGSPAAGPAGFGRVPFELQSAEQRFLTAGEQYMAGLSELDTCHHRVIAELEVACNDITEEELGKLGVALLNCQSKSEGRPTYTCTREMTLGECTRGMDATTWNTYHIISDRSRSVCYGVRQQQFQLQTRLAVDQLASTATDQLHLMDDLREGQNDLHSVTSDTLKIMADGQEDLLTKQEVIRSSQGELQETIEDNMKVLTDEKALIASGHRELASMTDSIRQQLDNATKQLLNQDADLRRNHEELQKDLASIRLKAKEVWDKLDSNMDHVAMYQGDTFQYYQDTVDNLKKMNETINYLLNLVNDMQTGIDARLGWLTSLVGGVGENLSLLSTCAAHLAYFLLASLCVTFLHTPTFSRIVLLLLVPLNALAEVRHSASLEFSGLTILIVGVVLVNWVVILVMGSRTIKSLVRGSEALGRDADPRGPCQCNLSRPRLTLPPAVNRTVGGFSEFSDDEDYTLPSDLSAITGDSVSQTFNTEALSDSTMFGRDTTMGSIGTGLGLTSLNSGGQSVSKRGTPYAETPMPSSPSLLYFGSMAHQSNPARRHLAATLEELPTPSASPRMQREGTPSSSRPSTPGSSRTGTPGKRLCNGLTKTGQHCRLACSQGSDFCFRHTETK